MNCKRPIATRLAIALSACCFPLASHGADDPARLRAAVDGAIRPLMAQYDVPGMAVAVTIDGKAFFFNYGVASREQKTLVSESTLFEIGSISKTLTGTLASYAQVLGKLALDDHPGKFIPQLKGKAIDKASLLNLGTYTAGGLPLQFPDEVVNARMVDYFGQWTPDAAPGTQRRYSNPSIGLLGHISAMAMGSSFADAMEQQLFPQLGLSHTHIRMPAPAEADYAWGYAKENKPIRMNPGVLAFEAYGVKSTAADMIRYVQLNIDPGSLEKPMQRAIEGTHIPYFKVGNMAQGLGWEQYAYPVTLEHLQAGNASGMLLDANPAQKIAAPRLPSGPTWFNKSGSTAGFCAYAAFVPDRKIGIVMLANRSYPIAERIKAAHAILTQLAHAPH